jgi:hypothetical protein
LVLLIFKRWEELSQTKAANNNSMNAHSNVGFNLSRAINKNRSKRETTNIGWYFVLAIRNVLTLL